MRIISGTMKGRKLNNFKGKDIRPTADKVKEAIFSMIAGYVNESIVFDLFSGTGNLGLEALSRGAAKCYFCDNSYESVKLTRSNIEICRAEDRSKVISGSFEKALLTVQEKADVIFLDPPYRKGLMESCFEKISELESLNENGVIVAEHGTNEVLPDVIAGFNKIRERRYGTILVSLYGM